MSSARLVIGYGNPLRADDGLGWVVAQRLRAVLDGDDCGGGVVVLAEHQLTPELAEPIARAQLVIFVDARAGDRPGRIDARLVTPDRDHAPAFSHDVDPSALVQMARHLYGGCPSAIVISVDGADFGYGAQLSPIVEAAIPEVMRRIHGILAGGGTRALGILCGGFPRPHDSRGLSCTS